MSNPADFVISLAEYHAGVAKLWSALGKSDASPQEVDVFTQVEQRVEQLTADNDLLRQALESATSWLEAAAMGCDQGGRQYGDAAERARQVLNGGDDGE